MTRTVDDMTYVVSYAEEAFTLKNIFAEMGDGAQGKEFFCRQANIHTGTEQGIQE